MKKTQIFKMCFIALLVIATFWLSSYEMETIGTISGLTLVPAFIGICWLFSMMIVRSMKEFIKLYWELDD